MKTSQNNQGEQYSEQESQRRFEAALRGAREVGHESMKDISPKAKASTKANPPKRRGRPKKGEYPELDE